MSPVQVAAVRRLPAYSPIRKRGFDLRIALVVPPWGPDDIRARDTRGISGCWPTPGLQYVAAVLRDRGHTVRFLEGYFYTNDEMRRMIREFRAEAVGVYVISLLWDHASKLIFDVKADNPAVFTFIGGHGATAMPERMMEECPSLDAIVAGEGEITAGEMMDALAAGESLAAVKGLLFRNPMGELVTTGPRPMIHDLDLLPFPAVDLCEMDRYWPSFEQVSTVPAMQMLASRGCNGSCIYCYKMYGKKIRLRSPARIVDEIESYIRNYGAREIKFWDEHFTYSHDHVYAFCDELIRRKVNVRWWVSCRADSVDKHILRAMKAAGCWCINFGVESGNQKNLDTLMKMETTERIRTAVKLAHSVGIKTHTTYIFGIPGETFAEGLETIEFARELGSFTVEFFPITPFPGTPLYKGVQQGRFGLMSEKLDDQGMLLDRPCFVPFSMTAEEIMELRRLAYIRYFLRPSFVFYRLRNLMSPFQLRAMIHGAWSLMQMVGEQTLKLLKPGA
jgi:anaerobic magnesium-protoporphyrin IX monomethyl ester cyclase